MNKRRRARCNSVSDQVPVASSLRSGARRTSCRIRACSASPYLRCGPGLGKSSRAHSPILLKRLVTFVTGLWLFQPTRRAASLKLFPSETESLATARSWRMRCSLEARLTRCNSLLSSSVNGLKGSDAERDIAGLLPCVFVQHLTFPSELATDPLVVVDEASMLDGIMSPRFAAGHAGTTYGKSLPRSCWDTDGFSPEGTAVFTTRDSIASGALSARVRPLRAAKLYVAGVPTT